jgi:hypothetical protein
MSSLLELRVPAPWGVGIMLGLKHDWVRPGSADPSILPGATLEVWQDQGGAGYLPVWHKLHHLARRRGFSALGLAAPLTAFTPGLSGWIDLVDVLLHDHDPGLCVWLLANPRPAWLQPVAPHALARPDGVAPLPAPYVRPAGASLDAR